MVSCLLTPSSHSLEPPSQLGLRHSRILLSNLVIQCLSRPKRAEGPRNAQEHGSERAATRGGDPGANLSPWPRLPTVPQRSAGSGPNPKQPTLSCPGFSYWEWGLSLTPLTPGAADSGLLHRQGYRDPALWIGLPTSGSPAPFFPRELHSQ